MKKKVCSFLLALVMLLSLVPTVAFAAGEKVCKIDTTEYGTLADAITAVGESTDKTIVLLADCASVDFGSKTLTLDLNGFRLTGTSSNAANVTIANSGAKKTTLEATGVYANDCSAFVADCFDAVDSSNEDKEDPVNDGKKVIDNTNPEAFTVKVVTSIDDDRATTRTDATAAPSDSGYVDEQDVYEGDSVYVEVRVYGARFVGADVTLGYDTAKFDMVDSPVAGWTGDDEDSDDDADGFTRYYNPAQGDGTVYFEPEEVDENGEFYYLLGDFEFVAKACATDTFDIPFRVRAAVTDEPDFSSDQTAYPRKTFVTGGWAQGASTQAAVPLADTNLKNAYVNIRMVKMTANVTAESNLTYDTSEKNLLKTTYTVVDTLRDNAPVTGTTIRYAVQTKEQAEGVQAKDAQGELLYWTSNDTTTRTQTTTQTDYKVYETGKEPKELQDSDWGDTMKATNAGDYVIYYEITKTGYATVTGKIENTIAKSEIDLTWTNGGFNKGTKTSENPLPPHGYYTDYTAGGEGTAKTMPTASFQDGANVQQNATITVTKKDGVAPTTVITELKDVAVYELTATLPDAIKDNYVVKNPTINVLIDGSQITGYSLANKEGEGTEKWYDAKGHTPAQLVNNEGTGGVTIKYTVLKNGQPMKDAAGNEINKDVEAIPADLTAVGTYTVKATLTKTGYYDKELTPVTFTIKSAEIKVEKFDWVTGWDIVLVYTNEDGVHFTYDGQDMFDVTSLGYCYGETLNIDGTVGDKTNGHYNHVYGLVVYGDANTNLVVSSNGSVKSINNTQGSAVDARCNINHSESTTGATGAKAGVDIQDLTACQAIYNVETEKYMKTLVDEEATVAARTKSLEDFPNRKDDQGTALDEFGNPIVVYKANITEEYMGVILKADVDGNKLVDTRDCSQIKANTENN